jgi:hypothetical protein
LFICSARLFQEVFRGLNSGRAFDTQERADLIDLRRRSSSTLPISSTVSAGID